MRALHLFLLAPLAGTSAVAQTADYQGNLGGTVGISVPTGEFADTWGKNTFTFGGQLAFPLGRLPFQGGFAFDYSFMGKSFATVPVSDPALTAAEGSLAVRAKMISYHPLLRFSPFKGKVRPYMDGMLGMRQFTTVSKVTAQGLDAPVSRDRNANDFAFSAGWAAGVMVGLGGIGYVEARVERFKSGKASYVDPNSIAVDASGNIQYNTLNSSTDAVNVLFGIGLRF